MQQVEGWIGPMRRGLLLPVADARWGFVEGLEHQRRQLDALVK